MQATITAKGQVTVPKTIRDKLRLAPGDKIDFILVSDDEVRVVPVTASVKDLKGMVPRPRKPVTLEQMDDAIAKSHGRIR